MIDSESPRTAAELFEELAAVQHEIWASWEKYLHSKGDCVGTAAFFAFAIRKDGTIRNLQDGDLVIPGALVERWKRQIATPYAELTPAEQVSDREQVLKFWDLIRSYVAWWIVNNTPGPLDIGLDVTWSIAMQSVAWELCPECGATVNKRSIEAGHRPDCSLVPQLGSMSDGGADERRASAGGADRDR